MGAPESNKAKIAKRVIEVLEFFDEQHPNATVMDIVRRYNRPQSSTSELLSSLVDLGLLYKDPSSRSYTLTPRAAMLGGSTQPDIVRDGRLTALVDRLVSQTGLSVAVYGLVGLNAQIFIWRSGTRTVRSADPKGFCGGLQEPLSESAAGWLLLSTIGNPRRDGLLRRLNAEAPDDRKFVFAEISAQVQICHDQGYALGYAGFGSSAESCSILLTGLTADRPMAIGFVYESSPQIDSEALVRCLNDAAKHCLTKTVLEEATVQAITVQAISSAA
jgi:DNA-binding IclR family transcriptional regulator